MENILYGISYVLTGLVEIYIISRFMCMFAGESTKQKKVYFKRNCLWSAICLLSQCIFECSYGFFNFISNIVLLW